MCVLLKVNQGIAYVSDMNLNSGCFFNIYKFHEQFLPTNSTYSNCHYNWNILHPNPGNFHISRLRTSAMEKPWRAIHQGEIVAFWGWNLSRSMAHIIAFYLHMKDALQQYLTSTYLLVSSF